MQFAVQTTRIVYAVNDDPNDTLNPVTELDVLQDNGCRIKQLTKPFRITFRPKISLGQAGVAGVVYAQPRFKQWLPTTDPNCINMEH